MKPEERSRGRTIYWVQSHGDNKLEPTGSAQRQSPLSGLRRPLLAATGRCDSQHYLSGTIPAPLRNTYSSRPKEKVALKQAVQVLLQAVGLQAVGLLLQALQVHVLPLAVPHHGPLLGRSAASESSPVCFSILSPLTTVVLTTLLTFRPCTCSTSNSDTAAAPEAGDSEKVNWREDEKISQHRRLCAMWSVPMTFCGTLL
ncbi:hypothetical protein EYF80_046864 [Liparis tanakae]|uniref:Uncharacterized protein n=1 Tax=Liparis tanakae TaxID=230148 RepID=A0A4Z2FQ64_9TELE|nr:hypothetical protein EYF80_046864 [Liparis tanakae]